MNNCNLCPVQNICPDAKMGEESSVDLDTLKHLLKETGAPAELQTLVAQMKPEDVHVIMAPMMGSMPEDYRAVIARFEPIFMKEGPTPKSEHLVKLLKMEGAQAAHRFIDEHWPNVKPASVKAKTKSRSSLHSVMDDVFGHGGIFNGQQKATTH
jgi:hypothetical protein